MLPDFSLTDYAPQTDEEPIVLTNNLKAEPSKRVIVEGPQTLPRTHLFSDADANKRFEAINKELNIKNKKEKNKAFTNFWKVFGGIVLVLLGALGLKKILK